MPGWPAGTAAPGVVERALPWARFERVCAISSAFALRRKTTWMPPSPPPGTSSWLMRSEMRWKLFSSAMMMSLFVRSSGMIFWTDTCSAWPAAGAPAGACGGMPGPPGCAGRGCPGASSVRFVPGRPCAWKIWLILSAMSFADA